MKCRRDNKPPTFLIITPVFRGVPARKEGGYFARRHDLSLSLSFFLLRVSLPPPDTLMSLPPSPPFTLPFRAFLFDLHPIATAREGCRDAAVISSLFSPPPTLAAAFSFFPLFAGPLSRARGSSSMARAGNAFECPPRCGTVSFPVFNSQHCSRVPSLLSVQGGCFAFFDRGNEGIFRGNLRSTWLNRFLANIYYSYRFSSELRRLLKRLRFPFRKFFVVRISRKCRSLIPSPEMFHNNICILLK